MLRKETINEYTLELLKNLMRDELLSSFFLAGGTGLALQIGHRISIDLDLFTRESFDVNEILANLEECYQFQMAFQAKNTLKGTIKGVKVDLIVHKYPLVKPIIEQEEVRIAAPEDIAAMKLNAITGNGTRLKDFIDVSYLSSFLSLSKMLEAYEKKYTSRNPTMVLKSLEYHDDINFHEPIEMLKGKYNWESVKERLFEMTMNPDKLFPVLQNK